MKTHTIDYCVKCGDGHSLLDGLCHACRPITGEHLGNKWSIEQNNRTGSYCAQIVHLDGSRSALTCERPIEYMQWFDEHCINIYA